MKGVQINDGLLFNLSMKELRDCELMSSLKTMDEWEKEWKDSKIMINHNLNQELLTGMIKGRFASRDIIKGNVQPSWRPNLTH
jgi:hypothetical protein